MNTGIEEANQAVIAPSPGAAEAMDRPLQFGLRTMLIMVAVCCVTLGLLRLLGTLGGVVCVVAAFFFTWVVQSQYCTFRREGFHMFVIPPRWQRVLELIWGIGMPALCLLLDPGFVRGNPSFYHLTTTFPAPWAEVQLAGFVQLYPWSLYCYAFCLLEMLLLTVAMFRPSPPYDASPRTLTDHARFSALLAGALQLGGFCVAVLAVFTAPAAALTSVLFGLGLMMFTPWGTFAVVMSRSRQLLAAANLRLEDKERRMFQLAGAIAVVVVTVIAGFVLTGVLQAVAIDLWAGRM